MSSYLQPRRDSGPGIRDGDRLSRVFPLHVGAQALGNEAWGTTRVATTSGGPGPGSLALGQTVTVSNSFSANVGITADKVTAGVGFNVVGTNQWACSYAAQIPAGQHATINAYPVYDCYSYDVWYNPKDGFAYKAGSGSAKKSVGIAFVISYWH